MPEYFKNKYRIDSVRLKGWDYRSPGWYFVTICTYEGIHFFGDVHNDIMGLSDIGCKAWEFWYEIPEHHTHVKLGEFIVMPNHVHLTLVLTEKPESTRSVETRHGVSLPKGPKPPIAKRKLNRFSHLVSGSLSVIFNQYKGAVKTWCKKHGHGNFDWQSGFYDHIVINSQSLERINNYIRTNPENWDEDRYHPDNWKD